jgi:hypothetical protein
MHRHMTFRSSEWRRAALVRGFKRVLPAAIAHLRVRQDATNLQICDNRMHEVAKIHA